MQTGMHIGTIMGKEQLEPLTDAIVRILEARADQKTIRVALDTLMHHAEVKNVSISNVTVTGDRVHHGNIAEGENKEEL